MKRMMKLTTLALLSLGMLAACGKKGGSGGTVAATGLTQSCTNCAGITATQFAVAQIQDMNISGVIELHGDLYRVQTAQQEAAFYRYSPQYAYNYYTGPVIVAGQLTINSPIPTGYCVVPAGTYAVRTIMTGDKVERGAGSMFAVQEIILDGVQDIRASISTPSFFFPSSGTVSLTLSIRSCM
ncbi:MAG: hypothetical protein KF789_09735 [Bdellovibrionaceae bacterium]|nr:hypothetical protein [Pseudobdellovibrionaceae bacterium]